MRRGILATRDELRSLRSKLARSPYDAIYETLKRRCSLILETNPVTEAQWRAMWERGAWDSAVLAGRTTQGRILDLLIADHIEPNGAYRGRAIEELMNLTSWTTWTDPCHAPLPADLCTAEVALAAVVGLDWLWEDLSETDRDAVLNALQSKASEPYCQGVREGAHWYNSCSNWNAVVNSGCGMVGLALSDESEQAREACELARKGLERFFTALGREGGWDEGTGYWGYAMRYVLLFGESLSRALDDQSILHQRGMDVTGLFPIYFTPNGQPASFGDNPTVPLYGTFYLLVKHFSCKELAWWLDSYSFHRDVSTSGFSAAGLAMLFRPKKVKVPKVPQMETLKTYHEIGWAAMADSWPHPSIYVAAKTGDLSASHSQHDMNSIQMQVDGEMLLVDLGRVRASPRYSSEAREEFYEVRARRHNTIVVAGRDHQIDVQGSIVEAESTDTYRWIALDSAGACGENVHFVRHVVMIVDPEKQLGETLVVLDELDNPAPETVEMFWHTTGRVDLNDAGMSGTITGSRATLQFALGSTVEAKVNTETHTLDSRRTDNVLRLSGGVINRAHFASIFTPRRSNAAVKLVEDSDAVEVTFGTLSLHFRNARRHMRLESVRRG